MKMYLRFFAILIALCAILQFTHDAVADGSNDRSGKDSAEGHEPGV